MLNVVDKVRHIRGFAVLIALSLALCSSAQDKKLSATIYSPKRMADNKQWTTRNLDLNVAQSYCYQDAERNCRLYGRLYSWASAQRVCRRLGNGWRLPTDDDWRQLARRYGGVSQDSEDKGKAAYKALLAGGSSGFDAVLGGGRSPDSKYERLVAY